jgi:hypothetical protein
MNERIRELADEAGLRFTQLMSNPMVPVVDGRETDLEKFAELVIADCIAMCKTAVGTPDYNRGRMDCLDNIKERFGIKK